MKVHANAALGPAGRLALCDAIESGMTVRAAAALNVAPATAHRWWHRRQRQAPISGARALRSSRPRRHPRRLSALEEQPICAPAARLPSEPGRLAGICRRPRSTIWKVLHRNGISRRRPQPRPPARRYGWSRPGALIHVDTAQLAAFATPGHRVTGRSTDVSRGRRALASSTCTSPSMTTRDWPTSSSTPTSASRPSSALCGGRGPLRAGRARVAGGGHERQRQPPTAHACSPSWWGRWAPARSSLRPIRRAGTARRRSSFRRSSASGPVPTSGRARPSARGALRSFLRYYNRRRPHSSLGDRPPISRVPNVRGRTP